MTDYEQYNIYRNIMMVLITAATVYDWKTTVLLLPILLVFMAVCIKDWKKYKRSSFKTYEAYWHYTHHLDRKK